MIYLDPRKSAHHIKSGFQREMERAAEGSGGDKGWRPLRIGELQPAKVKVLPGAQLRNEELRNEIAEDLRREAARA